MSPIVVKVGLIQGLSRLTLSQDYRHNPCDPKTQREQSQGNEKDIFHQRKNARELSN